MTVNLLGARRQNRAGVDAQMVSVEAHTAQIRNGHSDTGCGRDGADPDDGLDAGSTRGRDSGGRVLEHRATLRRHPQALRGQQVGVGEGFPVFDIFAGHQYVCRDQVGRRHACGGNGAAPGRYDRPAALRAGVEKSACAWYRYHVGGVVQLLLRQVSGCCGDITWWAYQFGDKVDDSSAVLDIAVEVETRRPALRPQVPGNGRRGVRVDQDTVAVE